MQSGQFSKMIRGIKFDSIPSPVTNKAKLCVLNYLGTFLAGRDLPVSSQIKKALGSAAMAVSMCKAPPIDGKAFLEVVVRGYEAYCFLGRVVNPSACQERGFDITGICGAIGAAVVAGSLYGLDEDGLAQAIAIFQTGHHPVLWSTSLRERRGKVEKGRVVNTTVFGLTPEGGNPCYVILDWDNMPDQEMQALVARLNYESVFLLKPEKPENDLQLRFFTPLKEIEMCGHAAIAGVTVFVEQEETIDLLQKPVLKVETKIGVVEMHLEKEGDSVRITIFQEKPVFAEKNPSPEETARALRIPVETLDPSLPVQSVSTSRMKLMVPLRELDVLHSLTPDFEYLWSVCDKYQTTGFYPFVVTGKGTAEARQFPNRTGQKEDPATGIAACALGAYLVAYGKCGAKSEGWHLVRVGQGKAMGRPSLIEIGVCVENKEIVKTKIMGQAIILP